MNVAPATKRLKKTQQNTNNSNALDRKEYFLKVRKSSFDKNILLYFPVPPEDQLEYSRDTN